MRSKTKFTRLRRTVLRRQTNGELIWPNVDARWHSLGNDPFQILLSISKEALLWRVNTPCRLINIIYGTLWYPSLEKTRKSCTIRQGKNIVSQGPQYTRKAYISLAAWLGPRLWNSTKLLKFIKRTRWTYTFIFAAGRRIWGCIYASNSFISCEERKRKSISQYTLKTNNT